MYRAAFRTSSRHARAARLLCAASDAHLAGDSVAALEWCEQALQQRDDPAFIADVQRVAGLARSWLGDAGRAFGDMVDAGHSILGVDPVRAACVLAESTGPGGMHGRIDLVRVIADEVEEVWMQSAKAAEAATPTQIAMLAATFVAAGDSVRAGPYLQRAAAMLGPASSAPELAGICFLAQALCWTEQYAKASAQVRHLIEIGHRIGSPSILSFALAVSAEVAWWSGHWDTASANASEAFRCARDNGQIGLMSYSLSLQARLEAGRGDRAACEISVEEAHAKAGGKSLERLPVHTEAALGLLALGQGDLRFATQSLGRAWELACGTGLGNPDIVPVAGDLAEALARSARPNRAGAVIDWLCERASVCDLGYPAAAAARAQGLMARNADEALEWYQASMASLAGIGPVPFEEARTLLCQGETLRRARRPAAAREPLHQAVLRFERLGAHPWLQRAHAELAAAGGLGVRRTVCVTRGLLSDLTSQELEIARAVARGMNNVEVAAALFISRKTVEAHLTHVYRKLGLRSRMELARTLLANNVED
jgi:DNA-binding CsgD family transcriptional regulator